MTGDLRGLIFDKDGTLFSFQDTWGVWTAQVIAAETGGDPQKATLLAKALGFDLSSQRFDKGSIVIAATGEAIADRALTVLGGDKAALLARMERLAATAPQVPATDLHRLFDDLRARGLKLGVVTNDAEATARAHLDQANVLDRFDLVLGYDSGFGSKPGPGPLLAFCQTTGLAASDCAMIGDSTHDLLAARAAGMKAIAVETGPADGADLAAFADCVLPDIGALPAFLDRESGSNLP